MHCVVVCHPRSKRVGVQAYERERRELRKESRQDSGGCLLDPGLPPGVGCGGSEVRSVVVAGQCYDAQYFDNSGDAYVTVATIAAPQCRGSACQGCAADNCAWATGEVCNAAFAACLRPSGGAVRCAQRAVVPSGATSCCDLSKPGNGFANAAEFEAMNPGQSCDFLAPGSRVCVRAQAGALLPRCEGAVLGGAQQCRPRSMRVPAPRDSGSGGGRRLSGGAIAGIVIAVVVAAVFLLWVCCCVAHEAYDCGRRARSA